MKIKIVIIGIILIVAFLYGANFYVSSYRHSSSTSISPNLQTSTVTPEMLGYKMSANFEEGSFPDVWKGTYEIVKLGHSLNLTNDARTGKFALKFTVAHGDLINDRARAELAWDNHNAEGVEEWYRWSVKIPTGYQDVPLKATDGRPNWQTIGQWHDQPDFSQGEKWDTYPSHSPSIALNYGYITQRDTEYQNIIASGQGNSIVGFSSTFNNQSLLSVTYGIEPRTIALFPIQKGTWYDVAVHILWSKTSKGYVDVLINGTSITEGKHYGPNKYNDASQYFKFGLYRHPDIPYTNSILYDDIQIFRASTGL